MHSASVNSEPGSNSPFKGAGRFLRLRTGYFRFSQMEKIALLTFVPNAQGRTSGAHRLNSLALRSEKNRSFSQLWSAYWLAKQFSKSEKSHYPLHAAQEAAATLYVLWPAGFRPELKNINTTPRECQAVFKNYFFRRGLRARTRSNFSAPPRHPLLPLLPRPARPYIRKRFFFTKPRAQAASKS